MKYKFKIGDKIKVIRASVPFKEDYIGKIYTIKSYAPNGEHTFDEPHYGIKENDKCWYIWLESEIQLVSDTKIVITTDGKTTTATKYCDDGKKISATAKCSPEDEFDFNVGAKLAMERLMKAVEPPKYYNGKIVCIKNCPGNDCAYTVGKIYEFVNGTFTDNTGWNVEDYGEPFKSFEDWNRFSNSKWLEIKE